MPQLPKAILFDLDDTLIAAYGRPELAWAAVVAQFAGDLGALPQTALVVAIGGAAAAFWADPEQHRIWRQKLGDARREIVKAGFAALAAAGHAVPPDDIQRRLADRFTAYRDEQMHVFPDAHATLDALRARGVRLALITNGDGAGQRAKIVRFALTERFDHIQIEGEHGFGKPELCSYTHALQTLGVAAREAWIVGDNLEWEVIAPQKLGLFAIWYDPHGAGLPEGHAARPDRIVRTLGALLD
ncbi:MAG TPA: HAD family hydrolase [Rhizomicrobium sp.]|jgi:putative hydrolase of the HAD superfamily|nr:HAD family hydrolase [Rhizomicrobium sp.]